MILFCGLFSFRQAPGSAGVQLLMRQPPDTAGEQVPWSRRLLKKRKTFLFSALYKAAHPRPYYCQTLKGGSFFMNQSNLKANNSIKCSVSSCAHHNGAQSVCSLSAIQVGTCGPTSKDCACTECASFELSKGCSCGG